MSENNSLISAVSGLLEIGNNVYVNRNTIIACRKHIKIGNNTIIGPNVCIYDHDHRFGEKGRVKESEPDPYRVGEIVIGNNVRISAGCIILRDTYIGDNCIIGAGCIIKGNISENSIVRNCQKLDIQQLN